MRIPLRTNSNLKRVSWTVVLFLAGTASALAGEQKKVASVEDSSQTATSLKYVASDAALSAGSAIIHQNAKIKMGVTRAKIRRFSNLRSEEQALLKNRES